jgi:hypothetical protein
MAPAYARYKSAAGTAAVASVHPSWHFLAGNTVRHESCHFRVLVAYFPRSEVL